MRRINLRENEAVTVQPLGVLRVKLHEPAEENVGDRRHTPMVLSACNYTLTSANDAVGRQWSSGGRAYMGAPGWPEFDFAVASA